MNPEVDTNNLELLKLLLLLQVNIVAVHLAMKLNKNKRWLRRRWLVRPLNAQRKFFGFYNTTFNEMKNDANMFFQCTRMNLETFNYLHDILRIPLTKLRSDINSKQRLAITLRYLSTGDSIASIALDYRVGISTCYNIIQDTCDNIFKHLSEHYLKVPSTNEWKEISDGFLKEWNFPNCCGAIDGKHVHIKAPDNSGSLYFNYKKSFSIVLLAVCDHKYRFKLIDVGALGSESDGGIFTRSEFGKALYQKKLNMPSEKKELPGTNIKMPYFFVGDEAFQLSDNLMRPYPGRHLTDKKLIFNYRLSRARRVIENSFGILVSRWRFLSRAVGFHPNNVIKCILAAVCLHNFLLSLNEQQPNSYSENENNSWQQNTTDENEIENFTNINFNADIVNAHFMRDTLKEYFCSPEGEVLWQYEYISRGSYENSEHAEMLPKLL